MGKEEFDRVHDMDWYMDHPDLDRDEDGHRTIPRDWWAIVNGHVAIKHPESRATHEVFAFSVRSGIEGVIFLLGRSDSEGRNYIAETVRLEGWEEEQGVHV